MPRVFLLSDPHLSPTNPLFWPNWLIARDAANAARPDLVVIAGDLCLDGQDHDSHMRFAGGATAGLTADWVALPGNHDIGEEPPVTDPTHLIDAPRLARWHAVFPADRFVRDLGEWRLIGLNAELINSGLPQEAEQFAWLQAQLQTTRPVAVILHKPLFLRDSEETHSQGMAIAAPGRQAMLALLAASRVKLVISGHLHAWRDTVIEGIRYVWLPALSFIHDAPIGDGELMIAAASLELDGRDARIDLLRLPGLETHDLVALGGYPSLRRD